MNSNIKLENGKLIIDTEIVEIREMEKNITKLQFEKVGWSSLIGAIALLVALFNIFVIGQLNSFRNELNSFENSINNRFDKLDHRMDLFEQALIESNKRSDILFQELINIKNK